jgi:hypothetical protein
MSIAMLAATGVDLCGGPNALRYGTYRAGAVAVDREAAARVGVQGSGGPSLAGCYLPAFTAMSWCAFASASYSLASAS